MQCLMEECMGALIWFSTSPNGPEEVLAMITAADSILLLWEMPHGTAMKWKLVPWEKRG